MRVAAHDFEHVIDRRIDHLPMDGCGPLRKGLHHFLLLRGGLDDHRLIMHLRRRQMKLIRGLDVRDLAKDIHELRQVEKLGKAGFRPVIGSLGNEFVKMIFVSFLNSNIYLLKKRLTSRVGIFLETPYSKASSHFPIASH